jgi:hypothetical protein
LLAFLPSPSNAADLEVAGNEEPWSVQRLDSERYLQMTALEGNGKFDDAVFLQNSASIGTCVDVIRTESRQLDERIHGTTRGVLQFCFLPGPSIPCEQTGFFTTIVVVVQKPRAAQP